MITIYNSNESTFTHNGLGVLIPTRCVVKEAKNGIYELEIEHPLDSYNKWQNIEEDAIIKAPTPRGTQLFRIYKKNPSMDGVKAYARHIFYDLMDNFLEDVRPTNLNGAGALDWILTRTQYPHNFTTNSDITTTISASYVRVNPVQALMSDDENSFLNRWKGEIYRDNFNINILQNAGQDRGVTVRYRKNLIGLECDVDLDNVVTRIMPTGLREDDTILILPEKYIDSPYINNYKNPKVKEYHFDDVKISDTLTESQAYDLLRQKVNDLFNISKIDIPSSSTKARIAELSKTEEYKDKATLETIYLYDIITIKHEILNMDLKQQAIYYEYDSILERYIEIEFGDFKSNLTSSFTDINKNINNVINTVQTNKSYHEKAIIDATNELNSALGGFVVKRNGELLIMDTNDPNTANKVWRWNQNGLGYSCTGYNGTFKTAITADGHIVADFMDTGTLVASLIKSGVLKSANGSSWINMDNGTFNLGDGRLSFNGSNFTINYTGTSLETALNEKANQSDITQMHNYLKFDDVSGLTIGKSGSPLNITISNSEMDFIDSGNVIAYVNGQKMYISSLEVLNSLIVGVHKIEKYNNNISLIRWVGGAN